MLIRLAFLVATLSIACAAPAKQPGGTATGELPPDPVDRPGIADDEQTGDGTPDGPGKLPMAEVEKHMGPVRQTVMECASVTVYEGKVEAKVTITPEGKASAVMVDKGSGDPKIDECIVQAFVGVKFPASERGQHFIYSFTF